MFATWWSEITYRVRALFRRDDVERELEEELRFHLEHEAAKHVSAGMSEADAMRRARLSFGAVDRIKEEAREARGVSVIDVLMQDLRYALRGLRNRPGFTAAVVITLALGIGANAAMFSIVDRLMFRPAAYLHDPSSVNRVYLLRVRQGMPKVDHNFQYLRYLDLARRTTSFSQVAAINSRTAAVGTGVDAREMVMGAVGAEYWSFFDAKPALGRFFTASEDAIPAGAPVVVLSYGFWQSHYGGRADVLGARLQVDKVMCTIIGVAPKGFEGVTENAPAVFVPITTYAASRTSMDATNYFTKYNWQWMGMVVRRKPGVSEKVASADLTSAYRRSWQAERAIEPRTPEMALGKPRAVAGPVQLARGPDSGVNGRIIFWISGVALIVLLIACANVANLLLARALTRRREIAMRVALGVTRGRLLSQLLTESLVLAGIGGVAGLAVGQAGGLLLRSFFLPDISSLSVATDPRTLVFAAAATLVTGIVIGLVPAYQAGRGDISATLKSGARDGTYQRSSMRTGLLVFQAALSVVLLVGAGLFVRSLANIRSAPLGYDVDPVLYVSRIERGVLRDAAWENNAKRLVAEAQAMPGVETAARGLTVPFWNDWQLPLFVAGIDSVNKLGNFTLQAGDAEYFRTTGTRILRGRGITAEDRKDSPRVMIISQAMAARLWPGVDAIGKCIRVGADTVPCASVVGIAQNIRQNSLSADGGDAGMHYYLPIEQFYPDNADVFVRVRGNAADFAEGIRRTLQRRMPGASYIRVSTMHEVIDPEMQAWRIGATMFLAFGTLALILAAVGLYAVIAYNVTQRRRDIGVRVALGARAIEIVRLVVGESVRFVVIGLTLGVLLALAAGHWVAPLLFQASPSDPLVFGGVAAVLFGVALLASALPAFRASRVDPSVVLRSD